MKSFDLFTKPSNISNSSSALGGWLTLFATLIVTIIIIGQIVDFSEESVTKGWRVDYHKTTQTLDVHIDIILPKAPCRIVTLDYSDFVGS